MIYASCEMLSVFCPARFRVLLCGVVLRSADTEFEQLDRVVSGASFLNGGAYLVCHYSSSICGSTVYAV